MTSSFHERDVKYQAMRSTGPGGQNVNKVNSAVRATHIPTGVQCVAMDSRSQHQNKKLALQRLKEQLLLHQLELLKDQATETWEQHLQLERGNPVRVFKGTDFKHKKMNKSYASKRQTLKNDLKNESWD
jgi:peptide chain release factor